MKTLALGGLLALLVVPSSARAQTLTADQVVEKHIAAMGGRDALGKLTSRKSTGTIVVATPNGDLSGPLELINKAPNKAHMLIRLDLSPLGAAGEVVQEQRFDGTSGWTLSSMQGDTPIEGRQLANMRGNLFPSPLLNYKDTGLTLELLPAEKINGKNAIVMQVKGKSGSTYRVFFDADTYLIMRTVSTIDNPMGGGELEQTSDLSDYRTVDGVKVPFAIVNSNAIQTVALKLDKVEHNVTIDDAIFIKK